MSTRSATEKSNQWLYAARCHDGLLTCTGITHMQVSREVHTHASWHPTALMQVDRTLDHELLRALLGAFAGSVRGSILVPFSFAKLANTAAALSAASLSSVFVSKRTRGTIAPSFAIACLLSALTARWYRQPAALRAASGLALSIGTRSAMPPDRTMIGSAVECDAR